MDVPVGAKVSECQRFMHEHPQLVRSEAALITPTKPDRDISAIANPSRSG